MPIAESGDAIIFYRTGGYHKSVVTTVGVVEEVHHHIRDEAHFISLCRKRSVFSDKQLMEQWRYRPHPRPFIVGFLYSHSFPRRPNIKKLIENDVIRDAQSAPRGFEPITKDQFTTILRLANADSRTFID